MIAISSDGLGNNIFAHREPIYVDEKGFVKASLTVQLINPIKAGDFLAVAFDINEIHSYGEQFSGTSWMSEVHFFLFRLMR